MADYVDLTEDEEWTTVLTADGWSAIEHTPINAEVTAHIVRCFGEAPVILRETLCKFVHLDIHVIPPIAGRDFTTYVTSGMSNLPAKAPSGYSEWERAELVVALPGPPEAHIDALGQRHYMIDHLRNYARRPHAMGLCYILGDTIGSADAEDTLGPDTRLLGHLLARPVLTPIVDAMEAFRATLGDGQVVNFLALEPIHGDELELRLKQGSDLLVSRLEAAGVFELYDPHRPSVATVQKAKGFSLKRLWGG